MANFAIIAYMTQGQIIFQGETDDGNGFVIRYPKSDDVRILHRYINTLSKEQTYVTFQGETISLKKEQEFLDYQLNRINQRLAVLLILDIDGVVGGVAGIDLKDHTSSHVGIMAISLAKEFRGKGIGGLFLDKLIDEAKNNLSDMKLITLSVFAVNTAAIHLYQRFGFVEYGRLPGGIFYKNKYVDQIEMCKEV